MPTAQRRITAAALKQQILALLAEALPAEWISQPLDPQGGPSADILIISPRGRCHFLFVRAPADRWWDGGAHSVPAERLSPEVVGLLRRLRVAGHRARAVWGAADLARALRAWNCRLRRPVESRLGLPPVASPAARPRPPRPVLHLNAWRQHADA